MPVTIGKYMVNREKVRLMTELSLFRRKNEPVFQITKYFRYDYIVWHMLLAGVRFTFCAGIVAALFVIFDSESFFYNINLSGIAQTLEQYFFYYISGLVVYEIISFFIYRRRYDKARSLTRYYNTGLRRLARRFDYIDREQRS